MLQFSDLVKVFIDKSLESYDFSSIDLDRDAVIQEFKSLGWTEYICHSDCFPVGSSQFLDKGQYLYKRIDGKGVYNKIDYPNVQITWPIGFEIQTDQTIIKKPRIEFGPFIKHDWYENNEKTVLENFGVSQVTIELPEQIVTFPIPELILAEGEYGYDAFLLSQTCFLSEAKIVATKYSHQLIEMGLLDS